MYFTEENKYIHCIQCSFLASVPWWKYHLKKFFFIAPLTPPLAPDRDYVKPKKTPERIEFENSIDGLPEESEEELTEHNLRASMSRDAMMAEFNDDDDLSDSDLEYV